MGISLDELVFTFRLETNPTYGGPFKVLTGKAVDATRRKIAVLSGYCITSRSYSGEMMSEIKSVSKGLHEITVAVFNEHGVLKPYIKEGYRSGTGTWGEELNVGRLVYIESIKVDAKHQRQGVGSLMLKKLCESEHVIAPSTNIIYRPSLKIPERDIFNAFIRKNGFRRIGRTEFFGFSTDPDHPSRTLASADDIPSLVDLYPPPSAGTVEFRNGRYPLHDAILTVKTPAIRDTLTAANSNPESIRARNDSGYRPLHVAVLANNKIAFETLIALGAEADLDAHDNVRGVTPLEALQSKLAGARASLWSGTLDEAMEMEYIVKKAMKIETKAESTQEYVRMRRYGCTCGECVKGWLSARMVYRIACVADFAVSYGAMPSHFWQFRGQRPLAPHEIEDLYFGVFLPPSLHPEVNKAFYRGFMFVIRTIRDMLLVDPNPPCLTAEVVVQEAARHPQTAAFFSAGGKARYAIDALTTFARDESELVDGTFLEGCDSAYLERPICANDLDFKMVREEMGLDPTLKWAPYFNDHSEDEYDYFDGDEGSDDGGDMRARLRERLRMFRQR